MIRDTRVYSAMQAIGILASLVVLSSSLVSPPTSQLLPAWLFIAIAISMLLYFSYNMYTILRGRPIPHAAWARNMTNRQLWTMKSLILIVGLAVVAAVVLFR